MAVEVLSPVEQALAERKTGYTVYVQAGGRLSERFYNEARGALQEPLGTNLPNMRDPANRARVRQARSMSEHTKITLNPRQAFLYVRLRGLRPMRSEDMSSEEIRPWDLGDKSLMGEILRLTEDVKQLQQFTAHFPHIFASRGETKKILRQL